jgi:hypothetical protein
LWSTCNTLLEIIISQEIIGISKISFKKWNNQIKVSFDNLTHMVYRPFCGHFHKFSLFIQWLPTILR